jgi:hypothetical protein
MTLPEIKHEGYIEEKCTGYSPSRNEIITVTMYINPDLLKFRPDLMGDKNMGYPTDEITPPQEN